jgi:Uma2 family endonuclease
MDEHWAYTVREYVMLEQGSVLKHEFYEGDIRAMAGGSHPHARMGAAIIAQLYRQLVDGRCTVYSSDLRVRIGDVITYPDASVVCGDVQMDDEDPYAQLNPTLLVEVTSPSSEKYDRGGKLARYKLIPSLREYVIVSHREPAIEVFHRADDGQWIVDRAGPGQRAKLQSIDCEIDVDELYRQRR